MKIWLSGFGRLLPALAETRVHVLGGGESGDLDLLRLRGY